MLVSGAWRFLWMSPSGQHYEPEGNSRSRLLAFHAEEKIEEAQQRRLPEQIAYIPEEAAPLEGLGRVNRDLVQRFGERSPDQRIATVDQNATISDAFRGRVMSLYSLAFTGVMPFAALAVARVADVIEMRRELLFAAVAYAVCGMLLIPTLRRTNRETQPDAAHHLPVRASS